MTDLTSTAAPGQLAVSPSASEGRAAWRLFISYRRRDSQGVTGRLCDGLVQAYGKDAIFRDVITLVPGVPFGRAITEALAGCTVVVVVIGPRWVDMLQAFGSQPGDGPVDFVRLEIETALQRGVPILPVLVDGAAPLVEAELPATLRPLAGLQVHAQSDSRWEHDLQVLQRHLDRYMKAPPAPWPRVDRAVLVPTALAAVALYAAALWWPVKTESPFSLVPAAATAFAGLLPGRGGSVDGGWVLLALALVAGTWRLLAARVQSAVTGRLDRWLQDGRVLAVVAGGLAGAAPPLLIGRPFFGCAVLAACALLAGARRQVARVLTGLRRSATALAAVLGVLALALALDIWVDHRRQGDYDVALLLPPEGTRAGTEAIEIFREFRTALSLALAGMPVDIAPARLGSHEIAQLDLLRPQTLLDYKGPRGSARVFIRIRYELGADRRPATIGVWPYLRDGAHTEKLQQAEDWEPPRLVGPAPIAVLALRAGFELIVFLTDRSQLRLSAVERAQVWRQLLQEFEQVLRLSPADCGAQADRARALRQAAGAPAVEDVRQLLFDACGAASAAEAQAQAHTARVLWSSTVRP